MEFEAKLVPWGASYGLRIRKKDVERLGLTPGQTLRIRVPDFSQPKDLSAWPTMMLGGDLSARHDDGFSEL